jgi:hypothetical protein
MRYLRGLGSIALHQRTMYALVVERDARLARIAALRLNDILHQHLLLLQTLLARIEVDMAPSQVLAKAGLMLADFDRGDGFFDRQGHPLALASSPFLGSPRQETTSSSRRLSKDL